MTAGIIIEIFLAACVALVLIRWTTRAVDHRERGIQAYFALMTLVRILDNRCDRTQLELHPGTTVRNEIGKLQSDLRATFPEFFSDGGAS
jgi:hypothetical protein